MVNREIITKSARDRVTSPTVDYFDIVRIGQGRGHPGYHVLTAPQAQRLVVQDSDPRTPITGHLAYRPTQGSEALTRPRPLRCPTVPARQPPGD